MVFRARPAHQRRRLLQEDQQPDRGGGLHRRRRLAAHEGFANAPEAQLCGGEVELQKYFRLDALNSAFFATRALAVLIANYTYTKSKLKVDDKRSDRARPAACRRGQPVPRRRAADRPVQPPRQSAAGPGEYGSSVAADAAHHLCQQARDQSRSAPGRAAPAGHHREARHQAGLRGPRGEFTSITCRWN